VKQINDKYDKLMSELKKYKEAKMQIEQFDDDSDY